MTVLDVATYLGSAKGTLTNSILHFYVLLSKDFSTSVPTKSVALLRVSPLNLHGYVLLIVFISIQHLNILRKFDQLYTVRFWVY